MKKEKFSYPPVHMGASFLLLIFLVLCLVVFSVLSLSGAAKDYQYSEQNALRTTQYYTANNLAEEQLAQIVSSLPTDTTEDIEYTVPVNDTHLLQVRLEITPKESCGYQIQTWKLIPIKDWTGNDSLPLLGTQQ